MGPTLRYTVTSMFKISPFCSFRESGTPWHTTSLMEVHTDLGNLPACRHHRTSDWLTSSDAPG